jgi:hypothetical protein
VSFVEERAGVSTDFRIRRFVEIILDSAAVSESVSAGLEPNGFYHRKNNDRGKNQKDRLVEKTVEYPASNLPFSKVPIEMKTGVMVAYKGGHEEQFQIQPTTLKSDPEPEEQPGGESRNRQHGHKL